MGRWCGGLFRVAVGAAFLVAACGGSSSSSNGDGGGGDDGDDDGPSGTCREDDEREDENGCTCLCLDGRWDCPAGPSCEFTCNLGDTRSQGCENCICADIGSGAVWLCTSDACCEPGATRASEDGCNTCTCNADGEWACTDRACEPCEFIGEVRDAGDGCNTCTCQTSGWACTLKDCSDVDCAAGRANCDGDATNGCEANVDTDYMNCGQCGHYCSLAGAYAGCEDGECVLDHCQSGYADCNGEPSDGCEAPVSNGCDTRCEPKSSAPSPGPSMGSCACPEGTACVIGSSMNPDGEYCFPLPEACTSYGSCSCLGTCVCPGDSPDRCREEMTIGGMIVRCDGV